MLGDLLRALTLLTRLPVPTGPGDDRALARSAVWFPLVGALLGLVVAGVGSIAALRLPVLLAAALAVAADVWLTGALHLDGLADSADGLAGRDREHTLAIMKDHAVGVYGTTALGLDLLLKTAAVAGLLAVGIDVTVPVVVAAYALSRSAPLPLAALLDYARADGTGRAVIEGLRVPRAVVGITLGLGITAATAWTAGGTIAWWAAAAMILAAAGCTSSVAISAHRRLGGVTGDVLGAATEIALVFALVTAVAVLS